MRPASVVAAVAVVVTLALALSALPALADELCPSCAGDGRVGCGACASPFQYVYRGRCNGCRGIASFTHQGRCFRCSDTGVCQSCRGNGMECLRCKGAGKLPDGTAARMAEARARERQQAIASAMSRVEGLVGGVWKGELVSRGKASTSRFLWEKCASGTALRALDLTTTEEGATDEQRGVLFYDADAQSYGLLIAQPGARAVLLRGGVEGNALVLGAVAGEGTLELTLAIEADGKLRTKTALSSAEGKKQTIAEGTLVRTTEKTLAAAVAAPKDALAPFAVLPGRWKGETTVQGQKVQTGVVWESVLDGSWLRGSSKLTAPGGELEQEILWTYDPEGKAHVVLVFGGGQLVGFRGRSKGGNAIELTPFDESQKVRWTIELFPDEKRVEETVEVQEAPDRWTVTQKATSRREGD